MRLDEKGGYVDINWTRTFTDSAELAKYVYHTEGPHVVVGGLDLLCKREAAAIVKNLDVAILKHGLPYTRKQWAKVAETAVDIG